MLNSVSWSGNRVIPNGGLGKLKLQHNFTMSFFQHNLCKWPMSYARAVVKRGICPGEM
jgi:hypothetical protein